jgi:iron(III) transport system ATP-binding protein
MATVTLDRLRKTFDAFVAVDDVSLDIADGELVALLGPSGCGKTTTLRMIAGFIQPTGGQIRVGSRVVSDRNRVTPPEDRRMSMIFQSYAVWPHMTVYDNVAFGLKLKKRPAADVRAAAQRMLDVVQLGHLAKRYPSELSGGQQQRVALARALANEPETLLLDEPLSNLDANLREEMRFEIRRLHDEFRITSIYVTHDQSEAMVTADRIVVMNGGRIEQVGTPEEIYDTPATRFVAGFIGMNNVLGCELDRGRAVVAGVPLAFSSGLPSSKAPDGMPALAIRPHDIELSAHPPNGDGTSNILQGRVFRQSFLGGSRDYLVDVKGTTHVRVTTTPEIRVDVGRDVWLHLPVERCRLVA